jgi:tetratricopeptide (TPR) repeat protein
VLGKFGETRLADTLARYLTVTPSLVPAFAALVKHESPPPGSEPVQGDALNAVCVHLMRALAEERPLIWIIDDLHFAPKESRDTVLALARAVEAHRVLLVATARPGVPDEEQAHLKRLENFQRISLRRLPDGTYVQTQVIDEIQVPSAVKDLIEGRLRGLDKTQRRLLDLASVQGFAFDPELTAKILGLNTILALQEFAEIERRFGLVRDEGHQTCFDQNQIQEVVYRDLTPRLRAEYHTLLAEAHAERLAGEPAGEDAVFVASHHLRGSRPKNGLPSLKAALEFLVKTYRNDVAIVLAARALETPQLVEGKERVEILIQKAGRHGLRGERELERAALDEALALADGSGDAVLRARVRNPLGWHLCQTSEHAASQQCLEKALELAREGGDREVEIDANGTLGAVFFTQNRYEESRTYYEKCLAMARATGDRSSEARATGGVGNVLLNQDRLEEARACYEKWLAMAHEIGDRLDEGNATGNLGNVLAHRGRYEEARAHHEKHLALAREIGDRTGEARATGNLGAILAMQGRYEAAHAQSERWIAMAREIGDRRDEALATGNRGNVLAQQGRYEEAPADFERLLAVAREIGARRAESSALERLGNMAEQRGEVEEARRFYADALALRKESSFARGVAATRIALGRLEGSQGDEPLAKGHLDDALALAKDLQIPNLILAATVERARLSDGDPEAALAALAEHEERATHGTRMSARFRLWELTGDRSHLEEAHRLLCFARDHAAEDCRNSIVRNVPLHREIMSAWADHGQTLG